MGTTSTTSITSTVHVDRYTIHTPVLIYILKPLIVESVFLWIGRVYWQNLSVE